LRFHESDIEGLLGMHFCVEGGGEWWGGRREKRVERKGQSGKQREEVERGEEE
jgi:hypothetical protein